MPEKYAENDNTIKYRNENKREDEVKKKIPRNSILLKQIVNDA